MCEVRESGFSGYSLYIKKIWSVANIEVLLIDSSTVKTAHLVSQIKELADVLLIKTKV